MEQGCSPSKVVFTASENDDAPERSTIICVHAKDCITAQCAPMLTSSASTTMKRPVVTMRFRKMRLT